MSVITCIRSDGYLKWMLQQSKTQAFMLQSKSLVSSMYATVCHLTLPWLGKPSLIAPLVKNPPAMWPRIDFLGREDSWRRGRVPTPLFGGFSYGWAGKESSCNTGDLDSILGLGRSSGEGKGYPLQYSSLENSVNCIVHGIATFTYIFPF